MLSREKSLECELPWGFYNFHEDSGKTFYFEVNLPINALMNCKQSVWVALTSTLMVMKYQKQLIWKWFPLVEKYFVLNYMKLITS